MKTYLPGVEVPLPEGERVLWQGSPSRRELALHAFHARKIAIYFTLLIALSALLSRNDPQPMASFLSSAGWLLAGGTIAVLFAWVVATLSARTTLYAITERRVVMKVGIALPIVLNIPLNVIDNVEIKQGTDGFGDLSLRLAGKSRVAFLILWPHARAWRVRYPEPLLRGIPNVNAAGAALRQALVDAMRLAEALTESEVSFGRAESTRVTHAGEHAAGPAQSFPRTESDRSAPMLITN